jgi:hypothetical protein
MPQSFRQQIFYPSRALNSPRLHPAFSLLSLLLHPHHIPRTQAHNFSSTFLIASSLTTTALLFLLSIPITAQTDFSGPACLSCSYFQLVHLVMYETERILVVHSFLQASLWELTSCLQFSFCFLHNFILWPPLHCLPPDFIFLLFWLILWPW